jgi:hypothetical protein
LKDLLQDIHVPFDQSSRPGIYDHVVTVARLGRRRHLLGVQYLLRVISTFGVVLARARPSRRRRLRSEIQPVRLQVTLAFGRNDIVSFLDPVPLTQRMETGRGLSADVDLVSRTGRFNTRASIHRVFNVRIGKKN